LDQAGEDVTADEDAGDVLGAEAEDALGGGLGGAGGRRRGEHDADQTAD